jgi:NAD(P)-dependent dehydrogenase (short-subunit alcohol dehydrogenase family)
MDAYGRIDILVNNAGILRDKSFTKMEMSDFNLVVDVHLMGSVKPTKAVWPIMKEQGYGRIIVTASSSGLYGNFGQTNYGAAKLGLVGFINTLKLEGQKDNIRASALAPVAFTNMTSDLFPPEAEAMFTPDSVAPAVAFMASEDAPTGVIVAAGAGHFSVAKIVETEGKFLGKGDDVAEKIAENWDALSDLSTAKPYFMGGEQTGKFFEYAAGKKS